MERVSIPNFLITIITLLKNNYFLTTKDKNDKMVKIHSLIRKGSPLISLLKPKGKILSSPTLSFTPLLINTSSPLRSLQSRERY